MSVILLLVLIFTTTFALALAVLSLAVRKRIMVAERLRTLEETMVRRDEGEEAAGVLIRRAPKAVPYLAAYMAWLERKLENARLLYRPYEFFLLSLGTALMAALLLFCAVRYSFGVMGWGNKEFVVLLLLGMVAGFAFPHSYLSFRESRQRHLLNGQIGDMVMLLANYLRAGHAFTKAMEFISREAPSPLADELRRFTRDTVLGRGTEEALTALEKRTGDKDLSMVITAIRIQHEVGGNLAEVLDNIFGTIRERIRLRGEARTLTAQGRLTAVIIGALPVAVGIVIFMMQPTLIRVLFTTVEGRVMLLMAVAAEIVGIIVIRRIIDVEV
ncbi:MAG: type II secretion system F family protein [Bacillota bacterium]